MLKYLGIFRELDLSGDGKISAAELQKALERAGTRLSAREFRKFIAEMDTDRDGTISFQEFCELAKNLSSNLTKYRSKAVTRVPRMYLTPEQYESYTRLFKERAGEDGQLDAEELQSFFTHLKISVSADKLKAIMAEVDDDQSGFLDEQEFMVLLIKSMGIKKRRVGPGLCPLAMLKTEGWMLSEIKRLGYECKDFLQAGYNALDVMEIFPAAELRKAGVTVDDLVQGGWDCNKAKEAGFVLEELFKAGVSVRRIRDAGWDDLQAAASMRIMGLDAERMRLGGWSLSELRRAGYSTTELRLAAFSNRALAALQQAMAREYEAQTGQPASERRNTFRIREDMERSFATAVAPTSTGGEVGGG